MSTLPDVMPSPDDLRAFYGATREETLGDAERRWLLSQPETSIGTNGDLWVELLRGRGYTGYLNDMLLAFWSDQSP